MALTATTTTASTAVQTAVYQAMATDRVPLQRLQAQKSELANRTSSYTALAAKLSSLLTLTRNYASAGSENPLRSITTSGGSPSTFTVTTDGTAAKGTHTVEVMSIATRHAVASSAAKSNKQAAPGGFVSKAETAEPVRFRLTAGDVSQEYALTLDRGLTNAEVMQRIAQVINETTDGPVTATVVERGSGNSRLVLQSVSTGEAARITGVEDIEGNWLADLGLAGVEENGEPLAATVQAAADAWFRLDGIEITSAHNTVSNLVKGITLELHGPSSTVSVRVQPDTDSVVSDVEKFISQFNAAVDEVRTLTQAADSTGSNRGVFTSDPSVTRLRVSLREAVSRQVDATGSPRSLAEMGLTTDRDGHLELSDVEAFRAALESNPEGVEKLWTGSSGVATRLVNVLRAYATTGTTYTSQLKNLRAQTKSLDDRIERENTRLSRRQEVLTKQIADLQATTTALNLQKTYLNAILASGESLYA